MVEVEGLRDEDLGMQWPRIRSFRGHSLCQCMALYMGYYKRYGAVGPDYVWLRFVYSIAKDIHTYGGN